MPDASAEALGYGWSSGLEKDAQYLKAGGPFLNAPATAPAYARMESSLMLAFEVGPSSPSRP